jgi:hypothetical protein
LPTPPDYQVGYGATLQRKRHQFYAVLMLILIANPSNERPDARETSRTTQNLNLKLDF